MKSITGNPALDAYQRMAVTPVARTKATPPVENQASATAPQAAHVTISAEAHQLAAAGAAVDVEKVKALKASIEDGSFQVDSSVVARRMLDTLG